MGVCVNCFLSTFEALQTQSWAVMSLCTYTSPLATSQDLNWVMCYLDIPQGQRWGQEG